MTETATALAQAVEALRATGREHKRLAAAHRKAARAALQRAAFLEDLDIIGITVHTKEDADDTRDS